MAYGQKNYNEIQGTSGYRINQIGCFLTSFANLSQRFGDDINPIALNKLFRDRKVYIAGGDLAYSSITKINPNIIVTATGKGIPPHNNAIVKFTGVKNGFGTHFALIQDLSKGLILDSWDGKIKHWNTYGGPDEWATYRDLTPATAKPPAIPASSLQGEFVTVAPGWGLSHVARAAGFADYSKPERWAAIAALNGSNNWQAFNISLKAGQRVRVKGEQAPAPAPQPAPAVPQAPQPAPAPEVVNITVQPGWGITHVLKAAGYTKAQFENVKEWDRVAALNGSKTHLRLQPNQIVRVYKQPLAPVVAPAPAPVVAAPQPVAPVTPPAPEPEKTDGAVSVPVTITPVDPKAYKKTLIEEEKVYIAEDSKVIKDLDGLHMDLQLIAGQKVTSGGTFTKDGEKYVISKKHLSLGQWYGIPESLLGAGKDPNAYVGPLTTNDEEEDDDELFDLDLALEVKEALGNLSNRERLINVLGKLYSAVLKLKFWGK